MTDGIGACVVVPLCKLPESVYMDPHDDSLHGKALLSFPSMIRAAVLGEDLNFELRLTLVYKDRHLEVNQDGTRKLLDLS